MSICVFNTVTSACPFLIYLSYPLLLCSEYTGMKKEARLAGADGAVDPSAGKKKI